MILLDSDNAIILETLNKYNKSKSNNGNDDNDNKNNNLDIHFDDHSESHFHLKIQNNEIILSLRLPAWRDISKRAELVNLIKEQYSGMWRDVDGSDRENYDISIGSELSELTDERIVLMSQLRQKVLSAPLNLAIQQLTTTLSPKTTQPSAAPITVTLNSIGDSFTVAGGVGGDQIIVLFATRFTDKTDTILAKVFLQEFHDTRKVNLSIQDAPAVLFGREPPKELSNLNLKLNSSASASGSAGSDDLNFITFVLFPRHFQTSQQIENLLKTLPTFRDYLHYHIKCSKAYLHQRMRGKTGDFLKLLNRAKPENF